MASVVCKFDDAFLPASQDGSEALLTGRSAGPVSVTALSTGKEDEILSALSPNSLTNVIMSGFIRDNGLANPLNRGHFYACHGEGNKLEGIALIGHTILFDAFNESAIQAFAAIARRETSTHLLMGEHHSVKRFWNYYSAKQSPRLICPVDFLRTSAQFMGKRLVSGLRLATREDLEHVVFAQAAMALETSGVDPLKRDPAGFRERYLRRIEKKRVWVLMRNGRLVFKTDIIADTPEAIYIEGVYVSPEERGKGLGRDCLMGIGRALLERTKAIYLFVEHDHTLTKSFYLNLGFSAAGQYDLLYF